MTREIMAWKVEERMNKKGKMFGFVKRTWNPVTGCEHGCSYCWARRLAETKLRHLPAYADGFEQPKLIETRLKERFGVNGYVFVCDMADLFGQWVPGSWILAVLEAIRRADGSTTFLLLSKNPRRYNEFIALFPANCILGATIESNRDYGLSLAPPPEERYIAMRDLDYPRKFVSIEPVMDFDADIFTGWLRDIAPELVSIGYDNYHHGLVEPSIEKLGRLIAALRTFSKVDLKSSVVERMPTEQRAAPRFEQVSLEALQTQAQEG